MGHSLVGTVLSQKYELIELIGIGGMAEVYKAKDIRLGRNVAVKVLKQEFNNDKEFIKRFQTESKAIASLSHANIVNVFDVGFEDDLNYIVMELVSGNTLKDYLESIPGFMKEEAVINIAIQICSALSQAHSKQVVHRDVKAQNILIDVDGRIKVADFGIARAATNQTIVRTDEVFGSVHYASPEQARGKVVDRRSDIYSLGILLYELLTRELPFESDSAVSVAMMQMKAKMPDPRDKNPAVTKGMAKIIAIATRKSPNERYQNAYEMISDLRKLKNDSDFIPIEKTIINDADVRDALLTEDDGAYDYEIEEKDTTKSGYMIAAILGIALAVILCAVVLVFAFSSKNSANIVDMPYIIGKKAEEGMNELAKIGVKSEIAEHRVSEEVPLHHIISASVEPGEKIKKGFTVRLVVSKGAELIRVPKLTDLTQEKALEMIKSEGFEPGVVKHDYSDKPAGSVIAQSPSAEEMMPNGTMIDIVVSQGEKRDLVFVPSLSGRTLKEAYETLAVNQLEMGEIERGYNEEVPKDIVISSDKVGEKVAAGTRINVVVSNGPRPKPSSTNEEEQGTSDSGQSTSASTGEGETADTTETSTADSLEETSASNLTKRVVVNIKTELFDSESSVVRVEFINGENKEIVYNQTHNVTEGEIISVLLELTGSGNGKILVRYDDIIKDEIDVNLDE